MHYLTGDHCSQWDNVQAIQHEPFLYISHNGFHRGGMESQINKLIQMFSDYRLDGERSFITVNPCRAATNPKWDFTVGPEVPHWIDGERLYTCDGVTSFDGNFEDYSHGFSITTNSPDLIKKLTDAFNGSLNK